MFNRQLTAINGEPYVPAVHIPSLGGALGGQWPAWRTIQCIITCLIT